VPYTPENEGYFHKQGVDTPCCIHRRAIFIFLNGIQPC
jgi:hypothetical protein